MKYTATQYAKVLYSMLEAEPRHAHEIVKKFATKLVANGQAGLQRAITTQFQKEWNERKNIAPVEVSVAEKGLISKKELEQQLGTEVELIETVDPKIGAGVRIKIGDWQIDNTLARRLSDLKNALTQ